MRDHGSLMLRAYVLDDEPLAVKRLTRLLVEGGGVTVAGAATDPIEALAQIDSIQPDVLFLDIEMPALTGFDVLNKLKTEPLVVFTTAYNQYALRAFDVNSIDYLLKPIEPQQLARALRKLERMRHAAEPRPELHSVLKQVAEALASYGYSSRERVQRLASRIGDKIEFFPLDQVTHIFAKEKLTFAATQQKDYCLDQTLSELESKLDPRQFIRIHRSAIVNVAYIQELHTWFAGRILLRLKDAKSTELTVARDRVKAIKDHLGI